jgi:integrase
MPSHIERRGKNHYRVVVEFERGNKRDRMTRTVHGSRAEAKMLEAKLLLELDAKPAKTELKKYLEKWLEYNKGNLVHRSYIRYKGIIDHHFDDIGNVKISKLTPIMIQDLYQEWLKKLSPNTVRYHHAMLHKALSQAVKWDLIARNPVDRVSPPSIVKYEASVLSKIEDMIKLIDACKGSMIYLPVLLAIFTGMRRSEITGLRWEDVDLVNCRIRVNQSIQRVKGEGLKEGDIKSRSAHRSIPIPATVAQILAEVKRGSDYVCGWPITGKPLSPDYLTHNFKEVADNLGFNVTFHGLRHSHHTLLYRQGIETKRVSERAGHSTTKITEDIYLHVLPDHQDAIAVLLEELFFKRAIPGATEPKVRLKRVK